MTSGAYIRQARLDVAPPGIGVDQLRMAFEIRTASHADPPTSTISVMNLAEVTAARLVEPSTARLSAGYRGLPLDLIFMGEVELIEHQFRGRNRETTLTLGSTSRSTRTAVIVSAGYQGVVSLRTVVADLAGQLGMPVGALDAVPDLAVEDYVASGKAEDALTGLLRPRGVEWYEVNGALQFRRRGLADARIGFVLSEATGMIGSPERTEKGVRARMRLSAQVRLDQRVRVESRRVEGSYKVISVAHIGDTWDGPWETEFEAVAL